MYFDNVSENDEEWFVILDYFCFDFYGRRFRWLLWWRLKIFLKAMITGFLFWTSFVYKFMEEDVNGYDEDWQYSRRQW